MGVRTRGGREAGKAEGALQHNWRKQIRGGGWSDQHPAGLSSAPLGAPLGAQRGSGPRVFDALFVRSTANSPAPTTANWDWTWSTMSPAEPARSAWGFTSSSAVLPSARHAARTGEPGPKKKASSAAAESGASEPWQALSVPSAPNFALSESGASARARKLSVGPRRVRQRETAESATSSRPTTGPLVMYWMRRLRVGVGCGCG